MPKTIDTRSIQPFW